MIIILDYDMGNVGSIQNMLKKLRVMDVAVSNDLKLIEKADKLILPGVGSYDKGMVNIRKHNLYDAIVSHALNKKKPILGICLGMQLLGNASEEGSEKGLGLIPFKCEKFVLKDNLKVPHMGWSYVDIKLRNDKLVKGLGDQERYYFVHSYHAKCENDANILMTCNYGITFTAAVKSGNVYGMQFHPEKSHKYGMKLLENFVKEI